MLNSVFRLKTELKKSADPKRARVSMSFFKTGPGHYGQGDIFLGLTVPRLRQIALKYSDLSLIEIKALLYGKIHEHRQAALEILVFRYEQGDSKKKQAIAKFYLTHSKQVNNWDLVDSSAGYILGDYLYRKDKKVLYDFAKSRNIWQRRIAIISTYSYIRRGEYKETLKIAKLLLRDPHDLIHKAVGWMLREIGKKSLETETAFLDKHYEQMPRTMLRYAIERFPDKLRFSYLKGKA